MADVFMSDDTKELSQYTLENGKTYSAWNVVRAQGRIGVVMLFFEMRGKMQVRLMMLDVQLENPNSGRCGNTLDAEQIERLATGAEVASLMYNTLKSGVIGKEIEHVYTEGHQTWYAHEAFQLMSGTIHTGYRACSTTGNTDPYCYGCINDLRTLARNLEEFKKPRMFGKLL